MKIYKNLSKKMHVLFNAFSLSEKGVDMSAIAINFERGAIRFLFGLKLLKSLVC